MRYTLSDLKRRAAAGAIKFELVERYGKTSDAIPPRCRGIRTVKRVNTVGIMLMTADGQESELRLNTGAKLIDYDGESLTIYDAGEREVTPEEQKCLNEARRIVEDYERRNPYGDGWFWLQKDYYRHCPCPWMNGSDTIKGKRYNYNGKVIDNSVRGAAILKYRIHTV